MQKADMESKEKQYWKFVVGVLLSFAEIAIITLAVTLTRRYTAHWWSALIAVGFSFAALFLGIVIYSLFEGYTKANK